MRISTRVSSRSPFLALILLACATPGSADPIPIPLSAFSGSEQVVQFTVTSDQNLPYSEDGATFSSYSGLLGRVFEFDRLALAGTGTLTVLFEAPVLMAGFNFFNSFGSATISAEMFADVLGAQSLGGLSLAMFPPQGSGFVGLANDSTFSRLDVTFTVPGNASFLIDDFRFDDTAPTPEPGTVMLTLLGAGWLGNRLRRSRQGQAR